MGNQTPRRTGLAIQPLLEDVMDPCYHWIERLSETRNELTTLKAVVRELVETGHDIGLMLGHPKTERFYKALADVEKLL